jgi:multimeric flavodoxin WrbA
MMRALGIYGSPRKAGNSDILLDNALKGIHDQGAVVTRIYVRDLRISGCIECGGCEKTGICIVQDDMQGVYPLFDETDVIILSSPIFFYGLSSQLKALVDRGQAMWSRERLRVAAPKKEKYRGRGYLIAVGATRGEKMFQGAQMVAKYFFNALNMRYEGGLFLHGIEEKGAVRERPEALKKAYNLGKIAVKGNHSVDIPETIRT